MFTLLKKSIISWLLRKTPLPEYPLSDFERIRHEIKPCDVVLVEGRSRVSNVIKLITQSSWSHAALYIGRVHEVEDVELREHLCQYYTGSPDQQLIIESELGSGTVVRPLADYEGEHIRLCRPRGLAYKDAQRVVNYSIQQLGLPYAVRQIFDLARLLFPWVILPRKWRSSLFQEHAGDTTETICSTMIAEAFGEIQFPILPLIKRSDDDSIQLYRRNPRLCTPSHFDYSPNFDIIKYPFIDFSSHSSHRLLPWSGRGNLTEAEAAQYVRPPSDEDDLSVNEPTATAEELATESEAAPADVLRDVEIDSQIIR